MNETIVCPTCGTQIQLTAALTKQIEDELRSKLKDELVDKVRSEVTEEVQEALAGLRTELHEKGQKLAEARKREAAWLKQKRELDEAREQLCLEVQRQVNAAREEIVRETTARVEQLERQKTADLTDSVQQLQAEISDKDEKLAGARTREAELLKKQRELEDARAELELEVQRRLAAGRQELAREITERVEEQHKQKELETEETIKRLVTQLEDTKRQAEQGSQQLQGEVRELALEELLKQEFPNDDILPVPKGRAGADVVQVVRTRTGAECGRIVWESKQAKAWNAGWVEKLRADGVAANADVCVILSAVLPSGEADFCNVNGVWAARPRLAAVIAMLLHAQLERVSAANLASIGRNEKADYLYDFLTGPEFRGQLEAILRAFIAIQNGIDTEKRAHEKHWKMRQTQLELAVRSAAQMYGRIHGVVGASLPELAALTLPAGETTSEGMPLEE